MSSGHGRRSYTTARDTIHLIQLAQTLAEASECTFDAAFHAKYEEHALVRWNYRGCRDRVEKALAILTELERRPDPDFDADPI